MATQYVVPPSPLAVREFSWSGIFSGTFLFLAIEATFSVLGVAIFTEAINPNAANPIGPGISIGSGIWMVVLSIIALYFAGRLASAYSATTTRTAGLQAGLVTYGMCISSSFFITSMVLGDTVGRHVADLIIFGGYWLFAAMVLGMIAAAAGGVHGSTAAQVRTAEQRTIETKRVA